MMMIDVPSQALRELREYPHTSYCQKIESLTYFTSTLSPRIVGIPVNSSHGQVVRRSTRHTVNSSQSTRHNVKLCRRHRKIGVTSWPCDEFTGSLRRCRQRRSIFIRGGLQKTHVFRIRNSRSRSSKIVRFYINRKRVCGDFLIVGPVLLRFRDIVDFPLSAENHLFDPYFGVFHLD